MAQLDVIDAAGSQFRVAYDASNYAEFSVDSGGDMVISPTGGAMALTVNQNAPTNFQINNNSAGTGCQAEFRVDNGTGGGDFWISGTGYTDGSNWAPNEVGVVAESTAAGLHLRSNANTYVRFSVGLAPVEKARFTVDGFGIGTETPAVPLDVRVSKAADYAVDIRNSDLTGSGLNVYGGSGSGVALAVGDSAADPVLRCIANGSVMQGRGAITTSATDGFFYVSTAAGTPTGTPTASTGRVPMIYDTTANKLWIYNGAWRSTTLA